MTSGDWGEKGRRDPIKSRRSGILGPPRTREKTEDLGCALLTEGRRVRAIVPSARGSEGSTIESNWKHLGDRSRQAGNVLNLENTLENKSLVGSDENLRFTVTGGYRYCYDLSEKNIWKKRQIAGKKRNSGPGDRGNWRDNSGRRKKAIVGGRKGMGGETVGGKKFTDALAASLR